MIKIITTGGTIEGLEYDKEENKPNTGNNTIRSFLETANVNFEYTLENVFQKDSRFITPSDRKSFANKIQSSKADKILITHGTITMVETTKYLGELDLKKTVVLVGSFILGTDKSTDAPFNLGYAIGALQNLDYGVYIAMHGKVFPWNNVIKNVAKNRFENIS